MVLNLNAALIGFAISGLAIASAPAYALFLSDTPKQDEMNAKYNLSNPTRNHQTDNFDPKLKTYFSQPARDLNPTLGKVLSTPVPTRTIDLSGHNLNRSMSEQLDMAKNLSKTHGTPEKNGNVGDYKSEYSKSGTRNFSRDATGKLVMGVVENVAKVKNFDDDDMLGTEAQNPNYSSEKSKESMYGDESKIFSEGKAIHTNFKDANTGKSASGRAYRAITRSAQRNIDTNILESEPWLQPSFTKVKDSQDPARIFAACSDVRKPIVEKISVPTITEHKCQDISQINKDYCEVSREIKIPAYSSTPGLRSCGTGCYEFSLNIDAWKTGSCRSSPGDVPSAKFVLNLNLSHGLAIKSVKIVGSADDHFLYTLNGQKLWESNGRSQSTSGDMNGGSCNLDGFHPIDSDVTGRVNTILGPLPTSGVATLNFQGDIRWKRNGGMNSKVRIILDDTSGGGFETKFIQNPAGCYDALKLDDKMTRGLAGVYDWKDIGVDPSLPPVNYQCTSAPRRPICPAGDILFGSAGQEKCYALPKTPICPVGNYNTATMRCEYNATTSCPSVSGLSCGTNGAGQPIYPINAKATMVGMSCNYEDPLNCGAWTYRLDAQASCPSGGTLDGSICYLQIDSSNVCDSGRGYQLKKIKMGGIEYDRCEGSVTDYQPHSWACDSVDGSPQTFLNNYCSVIYEDFRDDLGNLISTIDADGNPIPPPYYDSEGQQIPFEDVAKCWKPQTPPNTPLPELPKSFCTFDKYQNMEVGERGFPSDVIALVPPFYSGDLGNKTWKVNLEKYRCDPTNGEFMCRIDDATGKKICTTWEEIRNKPDQCAVYKQDPKCVEINSSCPEGWLEPISKRCMSETKRYECTTSSTVDYKTEVTTNTCTGMLPCIGGDCEVTQPETNPNFVKAMVAASVLDEAQDDSKCEDPSDPLSCRIFNGEFKYCSWETTGLGVDCCEEAKGVDIVGFIVFSRQMMKVGKIAGEGGFGAGTQGMYKTLSAPINSATEAIASWANTAYTNAGNLVKGPITSTMNSLMGSSEVVSTTGSATASVAGAAAGETATASINAALTALQQEVYSLVYNMLPESLANLIFTSSTSAGVTTYTANGPLTNALGNVMAVYAAYQMIKLAMTLLTACDKIEMDMGVKLAQRTCFKVGGNYCARKYPLIGTCLQERQNYCCYSSILSRIVMKESYSQLGIDPLPFGHKPSKGPQMDASCQGLTFEQFGMVNFEAPSMQTALQEWVGLLLESKQIPTETSEQSLTGGASTEASTCPPVEKPVMDCYTDAQTLQEVCEQKRDAAGKLVYKLVAQECIKTLKPGQIWNAAGRKVTSERTKENLGAAQDRVQESKNKMREAANTLDCSVVPRPPVCSFMINPRND
jgi:hypothetical protein